MGQNFPKLLLPRKELEIFYLFPVSLKGGDKAALPTNFDPYHLRHFALFA